LVYARIKDILVDQDILDKEGQIDVTKMDPILWSQIDSSYYAIGKMVGKGFKIGTPLLKK